jgi:hypothetical protein
VFPPVEEGVFERMSQRLEVTSLALQGEPSDHETRTKGDEEQKKHNNEDSVFASHATKTSSL